MIDEAGVKEAGKASKGNDEILSIARKRMTIAIDAYSESRHDELDDLRFYAGSPDNQWQWPADVLSTRGSVQGQTINARPCLTINKIPQHVKQVTNDQRQNRPSGKVIPADDMADPEVAEILNGIVRHVEYISDADVAYDTACENQVTCGEGFLRLLTEYADEDSFQQEIKIGRVRNPFSVYMDPMIQDPCGSDAEWCFITEDVTKEEFERLYPNAAPVTTLQSNGVGDQESAQWISQETIRIAEYFYVEHKKETLNLYANGMAVFAGTPEDVQLKAMFGKPAKSRKSDRRKVKWCKINGYEILEERDWAGKWMPVVRVVGNEFEVEGRLYLSGIVRNAKDPQRLYNYWCSQEAEMLALAPKAPFVGYGGQFEGYEDKWKTANINNWPYLEVNPDVTDAQGSPLPLPSRAAPPMASTALLQAKAGAENDLKSVTGQYNASLGMQGNEKSGKAIMARQREGDVSTYHYGDNLARAVRYLVRQIVDLVPKIYDTQQVKRIIGEDGEAKMVKLDPMQQEPVRKIQDEQGIVIDKIYNPMLGKYDVRVVTGPSYTTKRQEAAESMSMLLQGNPQLWSVAGDLFVRNMDWPGAEELSKRLQKTIDPKLLDESDDNPALQAAQMQMEAMGQEMQQMQGMLENVNRSIEARDVEIKEFEANIKAYQAETQRISAVQAGMSFEQIQDIVMGTISASLDTGQIIGGDVDGRETPEIQETQPEEQGMPMQGAPEQMQQQPMMPEQGMPQ